MAEARQAVAFQFAVTEEGVKIQFDHEAVKSAVKALVGFGWTRYLRARNAVLNGLFPASPLSLALVGGAVGLSAVTGRDPTFGLNQAIANLLGRYGYHGNHLFYVVLGCEALCGWILLSYVQGCALKGLLTYKGWMFDPRGKQSLTTKVWGSALWLLTVYPGPQLYSYQSALPRLPVPALKDTCRRYLESVRPLLDDEQYQEISHLVQAFQNGPGKKMQRYLILKSWWANNYVTDWWESYVYLHGRSSLMINSNYYACDLIESHQLTTSQVARAGMISHSMMGLKRETEHGHIKPLLVMGKVPLCSMQYEKMFGTTRIPGHSVDQLRHYAGTQSDYCVCRHRGSWFRVPLTSPQGRIYQAAEMERQFQLVLEQGEGEEVGAGEEELPALTTLGRTEWAEARQMYFQEGVNKTSMDTIEKAAFIMMFEDRCPVDGAYPNEDAMSSYCKELLHGNGTSRWFDKSLTFVVYNNGKLGINAEHSWADAPIVGYIMEYTCNKEYLARYQQDGHCAGYDALSTALPRPPMLKWELSPPCVARISSAQTLAQQQIADLDLHVLMHDDFGKGVMKKCHLSPDAFIQMALQMAYYKDAGKLCLTYEASMTRLYLHGRTETVRPVTTSSTEFVMAMCDPTIRDTMTVEQKRELLVAATDRHANGYKLAMTGQGIDRHLFCLYVMSKYLKIDSPFLNKVLQEPWRLSTSQTPSQQTGRIDYDKTPEKICGGGGFGPVAKDGYGVSYVIQGDFNIVFHISAFKSSPETGARRFAGFIKDSLREIKELFPNA